jgi:hypothetical protein
MGRQMSRPSQQATSPLDRQASDDRRKGLGSPERLGGRVDASSGPPARPLRANALDRRDGKRRALKGRPVGQPVRERQPNALARG